MGESQAFDLLSTGTKRWVWTQNWTELRDIQERAIEPIMKADRDVVIGASTAAGKTEAAFLPACSRVADARLNGIGILYISPLKALINDQYRRMRSLAELVDISITPWHGDVLQSMKEKLRKKPDGILLITPESLESLLLNRASWCAEAFGSLNYVIIDEFHAFLGTERGCQLQSLVHRLEFLTEEKIPRIALSATLGDMKGVAGYLRPEGGMPCEIIESTASPYDLKVQLRGYVNPASPKESQPVAFELVTADLYSILRGTSHLVFANSRHATESIALDLSERCGADYVPNEFYPHHGNLSKEIRESLEARLQQENKPTTAVCTVTLELGIDIGSVDSIAQVTAPPAVSSLRQRLGRSGRRGQAAVLRMFITEEELSKTSHLLDRLRIETIQCVAMVSLLLNKWYEPPPSKQYHLSTLVQQTLSVIGQYGGVRADQLWSLLCKTGPFSMVDQELYSAFLKELGKQDLLTQTHDGQLVLGSRGERYVEHYQFYAAFSVPEEYRLEAGGRVLGSLPITKPLQVGEHLVFAGRRWQVQHVDPEKKLITLQQAAGGRPPRFSGEGQLLHDIVRQEMLRVYKQREAPVYMDETARGLFEEGIEYFHELGLDRTSILEVGNRVDILPWMGDRVTSTITALLRSEGLGASCFGGVIDIMNASASDFEQAARAILSSAKPTAAELAGDIPDTIVEKHDHLLPKPMRDLGYGAKYFDVDGAWQWLSSVLNENRLKETS